MFKKSIILILIALVVGLPMALRREAERIVNPDVTLVVLSPHNESIRFEFSQAFRDWYERKTGRVAAIDWRVVGGTSEIVRFLNSQYANAFQLYWESLPGRSWSSEVEQAFANRSIELPDDPAQDTLAQAARRAFLESNVSIGVDLFFGGGAYDFNIQAERGQLVPSRILETRPEWFEDDAIPRIHAGEVMWDASGRWLGAVLSTFGIIFNRELLERVGFEGEPEHWEALADPRFFQQVAVADPTKSGSINKAFEMIVQQQMQQIVEARGLTDADADDVELAAALADGWKAAMRLIQMICANGRYFTDSATKPVLDVSRGDCTIGMAIDFYGRFQEQNLIERSGSHRFGFVMPPGGSSISADPIGLLRGAPNHEVAEAFIEFVLSLEGQRLWDFRAGTPGGPLRNNLRRSAIRRELYAPQYREMRSDPEVDPYADAGGFVYRPEWTGRLFNPLRFIIKAAFIDPHPELQAAWGAIIRARNEGRDGDAEAALAVFQDLSRISHAQASGEIAAALRGPPLQRLQMETALSRHFSSQFRQARALANGAVASSLSDLGQ